MTFTRRQILQAAAAAPVAAAFASHAQRALVAADSQANPAAPPRLQVSDNRRYLVDGDGRPFFYLGDTAWELFHRLNREEAERYLSNRAAKGFTVIQAVVLAELDGLRDPNPNGHTPLQDNDPQRPNETYFEHVDWIVRKANELGLVIGMLPTWGDKWNKKWGVGPEIFTPENAAAYGRWLGDRYRTHSIIWILGGDRPVESDAHRAILRSMAKGLREGDRGAHLMTLHPTGGRGSAEWFHDDDWLSFNMRQNGHEQNFGRYAATRADYDRQPVKPVIDGEPIYEDHPIAFKADEHRALRLGRRAPPAVLGPVQRSLRPHVRTPFGLADVGAAAAADQQPADAVVRSDRPAGRRTNAVWAEVAGVAAISLPYPGRHGDCHGPRRHQYSRGRTEAVRGHPRRRGQFCVGVLPDWPSNTGSHGRDQGK